MAHGSWLMAEGAPLQAWVSTQPWATKQEPSRMHQASRHPGIVKAVWGGAALMVGGVSCLLGEVGLSCQISHTRAQPTHVRSMKHMLSSTFNYQGLKNQKARNYDNFLRSNIDNEQDNRNFNNEEGKDHLPFRTMETTVFGEYGSGLVNRFLSTCSETWGNFSFGSGVSGASCLETLCCLSQWAAPRPPLWVTS